MATAPLVGVYNHAKQCMTRDLFPVLTHFAIPFRTLTRDDLAGLKPGDFDVLLLPGGWYFFKDDVNDRIRAFVRSGGGYIGICCGQINACKLGLIRAEMYSMYGMGPCHITPVRAAHPLLRGVAKRRADGKGWERIDMLRYNGWPMVIPSGSRAVMVAAYDMDHKLAAIAAGACGRGRVVAFSPHPEGCIGKPGEFRDRDKLPIAYDPFQMNTAPMLYNAVYWASHRRIPARES
jgi:hypothetical protein